MSSCHVITASFHISRNKISGLIPTTFQERILRVYAKNPDKAAMVQEAFRAWVRDHKKVDPSGGHLRCVVC